MLRFILAQSVALTAVIFAAPAYGQASDDTVCASQSAGTTTFFYTPDLFEDELDIRRTPRLLDVAFRATAENVAGLSTSSPPFFDEEYKFAMGFNRSDPEIDRLARSMIASFEEQFEADGFRPSMLDNSWDAYYAYHIFLRNEMVRFSLEKAPTPDPKFLENAIRRRQPARVRGPRGVVIRPPNFGEWIASLEFGLDFVPFSAATAFARAMEESIDQVDAGSVDNTTRLMSFAAEDDDRAVIVAHGNGHLVASRALNKFRSANPDKANHAGVLGSGIFGDRPTGQANRYVNTTDDKILDTLAERGRNIPSRNATNAFSNSQNSARHDFLGSYIRSGLMSLARMQQAVTNIVIELEYPEKSGGTAIQLVAEASGPVFGTGFVRLQPGVIPEGGRFSSLISSVEGDRFSASNNPSRQVLSISCDEVVEGDYFIRSDAVLLNTEPYVRPPSVAFVPPKMTMSLTLGDGQVFEPRDVVFFRRAFPVNDFNEFQYATEGYRITVDRNEETGKLEYDATFTGN